MYFNRKYIWTNHWFFRGHSLVFREYMLFCCHMGFYLIGPLDGQKKKVSLEFFHPTYRNHTSIPGSMICKICPPAFATWRDPCDLAEGFVMCRWMRGLPLVPRSNQVPQWAGNFGIVSAKCLRILRPSRKVTHLEAEIFPTGALTSHGKIFLNQRHGKNFHS